MKEFVNKHRKLLTDLSFLIVLMLTAFIVYYPMAEKNMIWGSSDSFQWLAFTKSGAASGYGTWLKYYAGGFPSSNYVLFYPVSMLLSWLPANYLAYVFYCLHISVGAFFFYLYLKELKCTQAAAAAMAVIYEFSVQISGLRRGHLVIICVIVYLPIVLYLVQKYFNTKRRPWLILSSAALALAYYAGHIQNALYIDVVVFVYLVIYFIKEKSTIKSFLINMSSWLITYILLICPPLIQRLVAMKEYSGSGSVKPSFDFFASFSMHPMKLLDFLFPNIYGNMQAEAFGPMNSSEFDFEIFLGFVLGLVIIFTMINFRNFDVRLSAALSVVALIYCICPHIPYLNEFVYNIPIFGGFRCAARALFIFCFFAMTIAGIGLSQLNSENLGKLQKFFGRSLAALIGVVGIVALAVVTLVVISPGIISEYAVEEYFINTYMSAFIAAGILIVAVYILRKLVSYKILPEKIMQSVLVCLVAVITLFEVYPYSFYKQESSLVMSEEYNDALETLSENIGNYKAWDAFPSIDGSHTSILTDYNIAEHNIQVINSYSSLNNPALYRYLTQNSDSLGFNSSGALTGSYKAQSNLYYQNNFLSMMGIKYILDNCGFIDDKGSAMQVNDLQDTPIYQENAIVVPGSAGEISVVYIPVELEKNALYDITISLEEPTQNSSLTVDFYGGASYDFPQQETSFIFNNAGKQYSVKVPSGDTDLSEGQIYLRFLSTCSDPVNIAECTVTKYNSVYSENVYVPFFSNSENLIYENVNANDILNIPQSVEKIDSEAYVFSNMLSLDLANVSYAVTADSMTPAPAEISSIDFGEDRITAEIKADGDTFVNFAECYFTGWKALVDGKEVPIHKVNGIIMGANVPGGTHTIEFRFTAPYVWVTYGIAAATLLFWTAYFVIKHRKAVKTTAEK